MDKAIDHLLKQPGIWRGAQAPHTFTGAHIATGYGELDAALPGGGWPQGALTEILHERSGIGELRLLMPALARLSHQGRWIALIAPPHIPYAPALLRYGVELAHVLLVHPRNRTDTLWAVEQALRTGTCGAVLAWPRRMDDRSLRRLQLAAEEGDTMGILFRHVDQGEQPSPAALRLRLRRKPGEPPLADVLKCRGGSRIQGISLPARGPDHATASESGLSASRPTPVAPGGTSSTASARPPPSGVSGKTSPSRLPRGGHRRAAQLDLPLAASPSGVDVRKRSLEHGRPRTSPRDKLN